MSEDTFTEVSSEGWLSRIMSSIKGIAFGGLLFFIAFPVLWLNEGRAVKTEKRINFAKDNVIIANVDKVDSNNEGKLIHLSGEATTKEILKDGTFGVSINAIMLNRNVEVYQWIEEQKSEKVKKLGGSEETITTYTYKKEWKPNLIDSKQFKKQTFTDDAGTTIEYKNPSKFKFNKETNSAKDVQLGAYQLSESLVSKITNSKELKDFDLPKDFNGNILKTEDGFFVGENINQPKIGDHRISFTYIPNQNISILAKQVQNTFSSYNTDYGNFERLEHGTKDASSMISNAKAENSFTTWLLRIIGFACMIFGLTLVLKPFAVIADVVPMIGSFVSMGTFLLSFLVAIVFSMLTISIAWIFYRPLIGVPLLIVSIAAIVMIFKNKKTA